MRGIGQEEKEERKWGSRSLPIFLSPLQNLQPLPLQEPGGGVRKRKERE